MDLSTEIQVIEYKGILIDNSRRFTSGDLKVEFIPFSDIILMEMRPGNIDTIFIVTKNGDYVLDTKTFSRVKDGNNYPFWQRTVVSWTNPLQTFTAYDLYPKLLEYWIGSIRGIPEKKLGKN